MINEKNEKIENEENLLLEDSLRSQDDSLPLQEEKENIHIVDEKRTREVKRKEKIHIVDGSHRSQNKNKESIHIVDACMGMGKSQGAIAMINNSADSALFLYITPYLDEIENRIIPGCPEKNFCQPDDKHGSKTMSIKYLLKAGRNIAATHSLFALFDKDIMKLIEDKGYTLIMDEVGNLFQPLDISEWDKEILMSNFLEIDQYGYAGWKKEMAGYNGSFNDVKLLCQKHRVIGNRTKDGNGMLFYLYPRNMFRVFKQVFVLTYLFHAQVQRCYFDLCHLTYDYWYVERKNGNFRLTDKKQDDALTGTSFTDLIHICDNPKLNFEKDERLPETAFSRTWYDNDFNSGCVELTKLGKFTRSFFEYECKVRGKDALWTTFKDYKTFVTPANYKNSFLFCNCRATNEYRNRTAVAYLINRYINPNIKIFFQQAGIRFFDDDYALSEMLQFIWRSAVRDGKEVNLYIPSRRMRKLLIRWLKN